MSWGKPVIAGNWKMNKGPHAARDFVAEFAARHTPDGDATVILFPPAISVATVADALSGRRDVYLGVQNIYFEKDGAFTGDTTLPSVIENGEGKILTRKAMEWFYMHYLSGGATTDDPLIAPIKGNLAGLPPAHLIVGSQDPLLDDSRLFAKALQDAGVPATLSIYEDQGRTLIGMVPPSDLLPLVSADPAIASSAHDVEATMKKIIDDAAG